ncbi:MAG TPA: OmpH family outer membrane protein [Saprospiraceae bacterium]|nr:OmpH family outer membrane protein [Saprospiraceae bacterium]
MKKLLTLLVGILLTTAIYSQKFGYINSQELLSGMAEIKVADAELEALQTQLLAKGQVMVKEFEEGYKAYMEEANKGLLSKIQMQKKEEELTQKQQAIQGYEQEIQQALGIKREELYKPILDKVTNTITKYGKDNGYTMIFDTSAGMLLYAVEAENLMDTIKAKLASTETAKKD